jgi:hypothetical protein
MKKVEVNQIFYFVLWRKFPTIHEGRITYVSKDKLEVRIDVDVDMCKSYGGGAFQAETRKFYETEEAARQSIKQYVTQEIKSAQDYHDKLLKRYNACLTKPVKK